jgi:hypothetical protein
MRMRSAGWRAVLAVVAAGALLVLAGSPAHAVGAPAKTKKSCKLLTPAEITGAFGVETGEGTQQGSDCTWQLGDLALSLDVVTKDAKSTFEALRDLARDVGSQPQNVRGIRDKAVFVEIPSFKELLVLKGKRFLFLRLLDIASPVDGETAKTALADLGKKAAKRV